ncbi:MAG: T9SS type A sorting domain-containing protein, partial [Ignavibacteriaceae bacterium]
TADSGWAVGGIGGDLITARTTNGGENWEIHRDNFCSPYGLWFSDSQNGWTVGACNMLLQTTDAGINWNEETQPLPKFILFRSVFMFNSNNGFVVGDSGVILKTERGLTGLDNNLLTLPDKIELLQNYPNPFNPTTKINYNLLSGSFVSLTIYDNLGRELKTLVSNYQNAGLYSVTFDGKDLPSGIYYYKLKAGDFSQTKKLVLLK